MIKLTGKTMVRFEMFKQNIPTYITKMLRTTVSFIVKDSSKTLSHLITHAFHSCPKISHAPIQ